MRAVQANSPAVGTIDRHMPLSKVSLRVGRSGPPVLHLVHSSLDHTSQPLKRHLDRLSRFAHLCHVPITYRHADYGTRDKYITVIVIDTCSNNNKCPELFVKTQEASSPSCLVTPCGGECIRPLCALGRHIRQRRAQFTHA